MVSFIRSDLEFILQQIMLAEANAAGADLRSLLPNAEVPWGLRTLTGELNNLVAGQDRFGAADGTFPRLTAATWLPAYDPNNPGSSFVVDTAPRTISNLIVDQTAANPAAVAAAALHPDARFVTSPGLDGIFGTADDVTNLLYIPNITPDFGLTVPFNSWFTFFGQFFDHGLDLVAKSGTEVVFIPLLPDDPLYNPDLDGADNIPNNADDPHNFMILSRAVTPQTNLTSPFVDQNQTYSSHPSHQVFLRAYELRDTNPGAGVNLRPIATGKLIENVNLGADGHFGGIGANADTHIGGMATWGVVKAQALDLLGIKLSDTNVGDIPLLATDAYGRFTPGTHGLPQVVVRIDIVNNTTGQIVSSVPGTQLVEGRIGGLDIAHLTLADLPQQPPALTDANLSYRVSYISSGHQFLNDIAHSADPSGGRSADLDNVIGDDHDETTYDDELLAAHYIAGDGRVNENIGLTAVHAVFHAEHNRLVDHTKHVLVEGGDLAFLNEWLLTPLAAGTVLPTGQIAIDAFISTLDWNGERLFQAAKFGTEMQYQHLVFEEFARTIQPNIDEFLAPNGYDVTIDPSIVAEFAHTVYRFGHSMLTETVDRLDPNFAIIDDPNSPGTQQLGLIAAFLNPLAYAASGMTPEQATGAIVRGVTRDAGNEIDEFVTQALRNNLVGLPLDLAVLNLARGRDTGIPSLNQARKEFYEATGDVQLKPYASWVDFMSQLKHPESLINFIAAYGRHESITNATDSAAKREAATLLVLGDGTDGDGVTIRGITYTDRHDFLNSTGRWASEPLALAGQDKVVGTADDIASFRATTGLDAVDFWIGGLAERQMPFGGLLGSTFNFVFETQLEALQNGDRFYYLSRTAGLNFGTELEANSFAKLVMLNSDATHLPANVFQTPTYILEVDPSKQFTGLGPDLRGDPTNGTKINGITVVAEVIRDNPNTIGSDTNYLHYTGVETVVLGGSASDDILIAGDSDDDTVYGDAGNDWIDGGFGDDSLFGGDGDDIIVDRGGDDTIHGDAGNDVIQAGNMTLLGNLILGGDGQDFIITTEDISTTFGGKGNDFILGAKTNLPPTGNEGDDWIEKGTQDGAPGDNFSPVLADDVTGNDIFIGGGGFDEMIGEGGDDIFVGSDAQDKMDGMSGFDWITYKSDLYGVTVDMALPALAGAHGNAVGAFLPTAASPASLFDRFAEVEGLSGSRFADILYGDDQDATAIAGATARGSVLTNFQLVTGLQELVDAAFANILESPNPELLLPVGTTAAGGHITAFGSGNIILGGGGSDLIIGRDGDDIIDGDKWLNVRISVRANKDGTGPEIASFDSMEDMIPFMLNRTYNPGQLVAVREILDAPAHFDTAIFQGASTEYQFVQNANGSITVQDSVAGRDGTDVLLNVERIQFSDISITFSGTNSDPTGTLSITDATTHAPLAVAPVTGQLLRVELGSLDDADSGINPRSMSFIWQAETAAGSGVFQDIILLPAGDLAFQSASGATFRVTPDVAGLALRVKAIFQDGTGVTETGFSDVTAPVVLGVVAPPAATVAAPPPTDTGPGVFLAKSDLLFILDQIRIAESHADGQSLFDLLPNVRASLGLRTVTGELNNLVHPEFGAADNPFPRQSPARFQTAEGGTSYASGGFVLDSQPRTISNLIVDQTANNPAAVAAAAQNDGASTVLSPGLDGLFGTADDKEVFLLPNVTPDFGLTAPFNAWMTFFGQFFDHGLDLVTKGGNSIVFMPLNSDDPLYDFGADGVVSADDGFGADGLRGTADDRPNFMVLSRATQIEGPGADGILDDDPTTAVDESADNTLHEAENTTSPFVDQNQTYSSHPSHQVFLRAYQMTADGPVATGKLIENVNLGADGAFGGTGTAADTHIGGMATWAVVKAQARDLLGLELTDANVFDVPLLATDEYGNFKPGTNGFAQVVVKVQIVNSLTGVVISTSATPHLVEGVLGGLDLQTLALPTDFSPAELPALAASQSYKVSVVGTGHAFLNDIAHAADPSAAPGLTRHADGSATDGAPPPGTYDGDLLDAHYIAGDGRVNENIGLTAVHAIFHSEHNRLVEQVKSTVLASGDLAFLNEWLRVDVAALPTTPAAIAALQWEGERLFQAAKFGTEMQYQHLVFEEFARTIQPNVDLFFAPTQVYDVELDASIVAEFAHTVYRFGHSMLTETVDRFDPNFDPVTIDPLHPTNNQQLGLIAAFLNPLAYAASGPSPEEATGAIVRGVTRTVGNEIDEFVTEALRNNLVGLPLDLAALNLARGRDTGIPSLNEFRRDIYDQTGDSQLRPYSSWADLIQSLRHPESVINFIAAYGTHTSITSATTLAAKRDAATLLVLGGTGAPADRLEFLNSTPGTQWANAANGVTRTGVDDIDFWIGGLAEKQMPFGGMLGSSFNFVFENQLEKLQDGDRFYYLERTAGLSFNAELEGNSFARLIMANSDATHLPALVFMTPAYILEVDQSKQFNAGLGNADPNNGITINGQLITSEVIRDNPDTIGPDTNYLRYAGVETVVLGGTAGDDILIAGDSDDDTVWGDAGNDRIDGGYGADNLRGGAGDDIITDLGGDDNIQGGDGNDVIHGGNGINLIIGGAGSDFIITGEDASEAIGGQGNDFILGSKANEQDMGNEGDDWIEKGTSDGAPGDNFDPLGNDPIIGNDVFIGDGENDKFNGEGGDDIMAGKTGFGDRYIGGSGFDWGIFKGDPFGVHIDMSDRFFDTPPVPGSTQPLIRFDFVEGLSGSSHADVLRGDDFTTLQGNGATGSTLTQISLISGLQQLLDGAFNSELAGGGAALPVGVLAQAGHITAFDTGNIILGGEGSDWIQGRGGDDVIDGDKWLDVRIGVDEDKDGVYEAGEASFGTMTDLTLQTKMLKGVWNPGQLSIIREILSSPTTGFDTAEFSGNIADYTFLVDGVTRTAAQLAHIGVANKTFTVIDNNAAPRDGADRVMHVERLKFADGEIDLTSLAETQNHAPAGAPTLSDTTPQVGQRVSVSLQSVTDADNVAALGAITGPVAYFWQVDLAGDGVFTDFTSFAAGEISRLQGQSITITPDLSGFALRVRAVYKDSNGVLEEVFSAPTSPVEENVAPVISSFGGLAAAAVTVNENLTTVATITATDANAGDVPTFRIVGGADATKFKIDATTGALEFIAAPNFEAPGSAAGTNTYVVTVQASDGRLFSTTQTVSVTVANANDIAPVLTAPDVVTLAENTAAVTTVTVTDQDLANGPAVGQVPFQYSLAGADAALFTISAAGALRFVNAPDFEVPLDITGDNKYDVIVRVFDGVFTVEKAIRIDITNIAGITQTGNAGANTLNGTTEEDLLIGLGGNDTFLVNSVGDVLVETTTGGNADLIRTTLNTLSLANPSFANVENLTFVGTGDFNGTGSAANNEITGAAGNDTLDGGDGNDTLDGNGGNDTFIGGAGNDTATGNAGNDVFIATIGDGNDTYSGGADTDTYDLSRTTAVATVTINGNGRTSTSAQTGTDTLNGIERIIGSTAGDTFNYTFGGGTISLDGGAGNDNLVITGDGGNNTLNVLYNGTSLTQFEGGTLTSIESVSVNLLGQNGAPGDTLSYAGSSADVTVNLQAATASGFSLIAGIESVTGGSGNDTLTGTAGVNTLTGGDGNDTLDGGNANDTLIGGNGDDTYIANDGDTITEAATANSGIDTVRTASTSFSLANNVENLIFTGAGGFTGTGNISANVITGGNGADRLDGQAGNDTLIGGNGADTLIGGTGLDTMTGGGGVDTFRFNAFNESGVGANNNDVITDFATFQAAGAAHDIIDLSALDAVANAGGNQQFTFIGTAAFTAAGQVRYVQVGGDTLIQANANNNLGSIELEIRLTGLKTLNAVDFIL